jgi:hypothetical protein
MESDEIGKKYIRRAEAFHKFNSWFVMMSAEIGPRLERVTSLNGRLRYRSASRSAIILGRL